MPLITSDCMKYEFNGKRSFKYNVSLCNRTLENAEIAYHTNQTTPTTIQISQTQYLYPQPCINIVKFGRWH